MNLTGLWAAIGKKVGLGLALTAAVIVVLAAYKIKEFRDYREIVRRLTAESRAAEVLVTESRYDEVTQKYFTTIKFLEYDVDGRPLVPKYFSFRGNQIQFQSLVVRFDDAWVERDDALKGRSVYLFLKAFVLDGVNTQEFVITPVREVPQGYGVDGVSEKFQQRIWSRFWEYALSPELRKGMGIKNAQLEAPGSVFVPGTLYTLRLEHDGGLRIDPSPLPAILKGERIPKGS